MALKYIALIPILFTLVRCQEITNAETRLEILKSGVSDWLECSSESEPTSCIEERASKNMRELTQWVKKDVNEYIVKTKRIGRKLREDISGNNADDVRDIEKLESENDDIMEKIRSKEGPPNGLVDEISDLFTYGFVKLLGYFAPGKQSDDELTEQIIEQANARDAVEEGRGHKKKYLKKQNKHLKVILLLMLFKNKVKMFVHKIQVLLQLKFLGIAVINLLVNLVRLWLDLKKHHKPHKVVYYENAHHQHHYDHEHVHDHDDGHYSYPGSHAHYAHHEEEYGGGPWPWSRSYVEKQSESAFQNLNSQGKNPLNSHNLVYYKQRPLQ